MGFHEVSVVRLDLADQFRQRGNLFVGQRAAVESHSYVLVIAVFEEPQEPPFICYDLIRDAAPPHLRAMPLQKVVPLVALPTEYHASTIRTPEAAGSTGGPFFSPSLTCSSHFRIEPNWHTTAVHITVPSDWCGWQTIFDFDTPDGPRRVRFVTSVLYPPVLDMLKGFDEIRITDQNAAGANHLEYGRYLVEVFVDGDASRFEADEVTEITGG